MTSSSPSAPFVPSFGVEAPVGAAPAAVSEPARVTAPVPAAELFGLGQPVDVVTKGERAGQAAGARFDVDLRLLPAAPTEAAHRLHAEAQAAGYAAGWAQGRREADVAAQAARDQTAAQVREAAAAQAARAAQAVSAVAGAAGSLEARTLPVATELEELIAGLAFEIATLVLGREVRAGAAGADAVARALALAPAGRPVTVRLHPTDHATVTAGQPTPGEMNGRTVTLLADPGLQPGDAVAECDATTIDARLAPTLDRVKEVLGL